MTNPPEITKAYISALLKYIPIFEGEGFESGEMVAGRGMPYYSYSDEVLNFIQDLYDNNIIYSFDWPAWQDEAENLYNDPEALASADLETLRKLLTAHVRKDRFSEGHLASVIREGHVVAIMKKLEVLFEGLGYANG